MEREERQRGKVNVIAGITVSKYSWGRGSVQAKVLGKVSFDTGHGSDILEMHGDPEELLRVLNQALCTLEESMSQEQLPLSLETHVLN